MTIHEVRRKLRVFMASALVWVVRIVGGGALIAVPLLLAFILLAGCGSSGSSSAGAVASRPGALDQASASAGGSRLEERLTAIDGAVNHWRTATDLVTAQRAAEEARNLVVGPAGPAYGDADRDGMIEGASDIGLLPGLAGEPGLASAAAGSCVERDVLGGSWADPAARWSILESAIAKWRPSNNTFPALPSHPQRIVGWATLTLATEDLATAREYGGHAHLHIDIAIRAVTGCSG